MNATHLTSRLIVAAALLCALPLAACGGGTVNVGPAGAQVSGAGAQVSVGPDGAVVSDGQGNQVSAGADGSAGVAASDGTSGGSGVTGGGAKVSAGAGGVSVDAGGVTVSAGADGVTVDTGTSGGTSGGAAGGTRQGTFGVSGQVALSGGATWAGTVAQASCDVNGDQRTITAKTPTGLTVVIDTNGPQMVTLTVSGAGKEWTADDPSVVTLTAGRTLVAGAQLAGDGANVRLQANFPC